MTRSRTYVIDTSVLLSDPAALVRFAEHEVVIPLVVVGELEGKRHHPELGWFARQTLRMLDDLRVRHGRLDQPVPVGELGGSLRVELNHADPAVLPAGFRTDDNDSRILTVALNLAADGRDVVLVTKDMPLRVKAASVGLVADEYRAATVPGSGWTGMAELDLLDDEMATLYRGEPLELESARDLPCHTGLV
ncbi:MAG: PhoH family protein, partial [Actinobacteria bacterium]|nr:PhoH family protein [Actinomycetota bacterium]